MSKLPSFMLSKEQRVAEAVCDSLMDGLDLPPSDGSPGGYDKLPYLPSDPYGGPSMWNPQGDFYWSRVYSAACNLDHDALRVLLSHAELPIPLIDRCITQAKNTKNNNRDEVIKCLSLERDTFRL